MTSIVDTLLLLPGDGIGPEVVDAARKIINYLAGRDELKVEVITDLIGGSALDAYGVPLASRTLETARAANAVLLGAVGGPKWADKPFHLRPEQGLLDLRAGLGLYANLRPALCFSSLVEASTLKPDLVENLDLLVVRELIGGVYFGEPRGIETLADGSRRGVNTQVYTDKEIERVAHVAFAIARSRSSRVCSVEKANVMESGLLWREVVSAVGARDYPDIELTHMYADNCGMQLVRCPKQFDVILTDNLFGDLLSDVAAMLTGSLGMLPSASLGEDDTTGLFEPIHGSAPDIAGQGIANPCATILSLAMALRLRLHRPDLAERVEHAVEQVLADGYRTEDLMSGSRSTRDIVVSTDKFTDAVIERIRA